MGASHNKVLTLRHDGHGQAVGVPWVAEAIALEKSRATTSLHRVRAPPRGQAMRVRFSGVGVL